MSRMVRLTVTTPAMVGNERDIDARPAKRSVKVNAVVWRHALAFAETQEFRAPRGDFLPCHTVQFTDSLRQALVVLVEYQAPSRPSRRTALDTLNEFFSVPAHRQTLLRIVKLTAGGGTLDITNE